MGDQDAKRYEMLKRALNYLNVLKKSLACPSSGERKGP